MLHMSQIKQFCALAAFRMLLTSFPFIRIRLPSFFGTFDGTGKRSGASLRAEQKRVQEKWSGERNPYEDLHKRFWKWLTKGISPTKLQKVNASAQDKVQKMVDFQKWTFRNYFLPNKLFSLTVDTSLSLGRLVSTKNSSNFFSTFSLVNHAVMKSNLVFA